MARTFIATKQLQPTLCNWALHCIGDVREIWALEDLKYWKRLQQHMTS